MAAPLATAGIEIRIARPADAEALATLRYRFRHELGRAVESEGSFVARCAAWMLTRLGADSAWRCWVAENGTRIVAQVWVEYFEKIPNPVAEPERHAILTNFFVEPELRNAGLGARLLRTALEACAAAGVDAVLLRPSDRSRPFYLRHGFAPAESYFVREAPRPSPSSAE